MFSQEVKTLKILTAEQKRRFYFKHIKLQVKQNIKSFIKSMATPLAKDINISYGSIIISSQDNIKKNTIM